MNAEQNSVMVILDTDEYCFLYDRNSFPEMIESILDPGERSELAEETETHGLEPDERSEIARELFGELHAAL